MHLLVSVSNAGEAAAALDGGADLIDAKDPTKGALGAVSLPVLQDIVSTIDRARPVTAALGDARDHLHIEDAARAYAAAGASLIKIGFAGLTTQAQTRRAIELAVRGAAARAGIVAVAYADADGESPARSSVLDAAIEGGAVAVLLDTIDKTGPGLRGLIGFDALASWVDAVHAAGLLAALAGQLTADDLAFVRDAGADIAGVRGAACEGGRTSRIDSAKVRMLVRRSAHSARVPVPGPGAACG